MTLSIGEINKITD